MGRRRREGVVWFWKQAERHGTNFPQAGPGALSDIQHHANALTLAPGWLQCAKLYFLLCTSCVFSTWWRFTHCTRYVWQMIWKCSKLHFLWMRLYWIVLERKHNRTTKNWAVQCSPPCWCIRFHYFMHHTSLVKFLHTDLLRTCASFDTCTLR